VDDGRVGGARHTEGCFPDTPEDRSSEKAVISILKLQNGSFCQPSKEVINQLAK
jgi:hypothetical protein